MMADTPNPTTTKTKPTPNTEDLSAQVDLLKADIARLTETLGDYGRAKSREYQGEARRRADDFKAEAQGRVDDVETYVRQNPAQALGIAAGVGLLIGLLSRR